MERKGHMVGVVVSWDPELRAPQQWVDRVYSTFEVSGHNSTTASGKSLLLFFPSSFSIFSFTHLA